MPQMGYDMQEGVLVRWLKSEGAEVKLGEPVAEIETDKAVVEFQSTAEGVLAQILTSEGSVVPVGQPIGIVGTDGEEVSEVPIPHSSEVAASQAPTSRPTPKATPTPDSNTPTFPADEIRASPVARRIALERGISLAQVAGTGPGGRITKDDVLSAEAPAATLECPAELGPSPAATMAQPTPDTVDTVELDRMRQQVARVTVKSKSEIPHFYVAAEIDMTQAVALRSQINARLGGEGSRVSVNDLIIKACGIALKNYPKFNSHFVDGAIQMHSQINIGIAIAAGDGLIIPAIMDCAIKSLGEVAAASKDLIARAKTGTLQPQEYTGGTFTISNLGMYDVSSFTAIIHPPQTAALAVGTVAKRPMVQNDVVAVAEMMTATLSADHRVSDGAEGAEFLIEVKSTLESPFSLLV